jgi:cytoskeleton protein RodZ
MLREVRVARGLSLRDAASSLRIRLTYLEAIESGRFKELPGPTYASGFLRAYAGYLGVDGDDVVSRFKAALEGFKRPTNLVLPSPAETGHMPTGSVFLVAAIIAIAAYGGWYYLSVEGRDPGEFFAGVPQRIASLWSRQPTEESASAQPPTSSGMARPASTATAPPDQPGTAATSSEPAPPAAPTPVVAAVEPPAASPPVAAVEPPAAAPSPQPPTPPSPPQAAPEPPAAPAQAAPPPPAPNAAADVAAATPPVATVAAPVSAAAPEPSRGRILLRAVADSWVELRAPGEGPIFSRILKQGETYDVPPRDDLVLTTGNAGGLEIAVDGKTLPPLGPSGAVQRNVALDPEKLAAVTR